MLHIVQLKADVWWQDVFRTKLIGDSVHTRGAEHDGKCNVKKFPVVHVRFQKLSSKIDI